MKHITYIILSMLLCNIAIAAPRGVRIEAPVKGLLLAGIKDGNKITKGVVFLADDGAIYASDSATISADGKSMTFKGKPLRVWGGSRLYSDDPDQWIRLTGLREMTTSKGKWQMDGPKK